MSYDLTLWHDPKLRSYDRAMARMEREKPASTRELRRLQALVDALLAGPLAGMALSIDPVIDAGRGTVGLCLLSEGLEAVLAGVWPVAQAHGMACYDPQADVVTYANGADSRAEKLQDGVHEGVPICLAELGSAATLPEAELRDVLDALTQFALADSDDVPAAVAMALPVLQALMDSGDPRVASLARNTAEDLRAG